MCWKSHPLGRPGCGMARTAIFLCTAGIFIVPALPSPGALQSTGLLFLGMRQWEACRDWEILPHKPVCDIRLSHDYTLLHCISKSPLFCRAHDSGVGFLHRTRFLLDSIYSWFPDGVTTFNTASQCISWDQCYQFDEFRLRKKSWYWKLSCKQFTFLFVWFFH